MRVLRWSYNRIKNRDIFHQTVSLTFQGKETKSNFWGGLFTIIFMVILSVFGILLLIRMFKKTEVSWNKNTHFDTLETNFEQYNVSEFDQIEVVVRIDIEKDIGDVPDIDKTIDIIAGPVKILKEGDGGPGQFEATDAVVPYECESEYDVEVPISYTITDSKTL